MKQLLIFILILLHTSLVTSQQTHDSIVASISKLMDAYESFEMINGVVLVAEGDKVLYQKAFGKSNFEWDIPNHIDAKFEIASISKQFTALMTLQFIEQGKLSFDSKITDVFPGYPKVNGDRITIEQLLRHTSGLIDTRHIEDFDRIHGVQPVSREELLQMFWDRDLLFEPGTKWSYSNFNYNLLAIILEHMTGMDIAWEKGIWL